MCCVSVSAHLYQYYYVKYSIFNQIILVLVALWGGCSAAGCAVPLRPLVLWDWGQGYHLAVCSSALMIVGFILLGFLVEISENADDTLGVEIEGGEGSLYRFWEGFWRF